MELNTMIFSISWKNIWRSKLRSLIIIFAITAGLWGGIISMGVSFGMVDQMVKTNINTHLSHIQIHNPEFKNNMDLRKVITDIADVRTKLNAIPDIKAFSVRTVISGMASSPVSAVGISVYGIDPDREKLVTNVNKKIIAGDYFKTKKRNPVIIGQKLADKLKLKLNSKIIFTFQDSNGDISGGSFKIIGIFKTNSTIFDESRVFIKKTDILKILGNDSFLHEIGIVLKENNKLETITAKLKKQLPGLSVESWKELSPDLQYASEMTAYMLMVFMIIILFALSFGIINTMLMSILDRIRELGMLMAIGMNKKRIFFMIVLESIFVSVTGAFFGMIMGWLFMGYLSKYGINLSIFSEGLTYFGIGNVLYPALPWIFYPELAVLILITAVLSAIYPAIKALKLNPVKAIRSL